MKIKNAKLEYYVFYLDGNSYKPKKVNILNGIETEIAKRTKSKSSVLSIKSREDLKKYLKTNFMYHYWCRTEYEYGVCSLWEKEFENAEKHDVWFQIENNLDMITDYIIYKMDIKF